MKKLTRLLGMTLLLQCAGNARALGLDDNQAYIADVSYLAGMCQIFREMKGHANSVDISNDVAFVESFFTAQAQAISISVPELVKNCEEFTGMYKLLVEIEK